MNNNKLLTQLLLLCCFASLFSCTQRRDITRKDFKELLHYGIVEKVTVVNKKYAEIKLKEDQVNQPAWKDKYNSKELYILNILDTEVFHDHFSHAQRDLSPEDRIDYSITERQNFINLGIIIPIIIWFALLTLLILPLILVLKLRNKIKSLELRITELESNQK